MQNPDGEYVDGKGTDEADGGSFNLPAYTVTARSVADVQAALQFANRHNIQVVIKNTGHSYHSGSTAVGSLMIWTVHLPKYGTKHTDWRNSCGQHVSDLGGHFGWNGEKPVAALKYGAGQPFREIYAAAFEHGVYIPGGTNPGVGGGGGWLLGGGISFTSRHLGLGIDGVVEFEVVTADGSFITADACTNSDMFWALRGGGGGSFGVVISVTSRVWADSPVQDLNVGQLGRACGKLLPVLSIDAMLAVGTDHDFTQCSDLPSNPSGWMDALTTSSQVPTCLRRKFTHLCGSWGHFLLGSEEEPGMYQTLDPRWGNNALPIYQFRGTEAEARSSFVDQLDAFWNFPGANLLLSDSAFGPNLKYALRSYKNYVDYRMRWGMAAPLGLMDNISFPESGVCPDATKSGECIQKAIEDMTGLKNTMENHDDGIFFANYLGSGMPGYETRSTSGCSRVFNLHDRKIQRKLRSLDVIAKSILSASSYFLGGKISDVPTDATAIGPAQRDGQLYMPFPIVGGACKTVTSAFPPSRTMGGAGYNHWGQYNEPGIPFDYVAWGSNVDRLRQVKNRYDPHHRFNAKSTFGALPVCDNGAQQRVGASTGSVVGSEYAP